MTYNPKPSLADKLRIVSITVITTMLLVSLAGNVYLYQHSFLAKADNLAMSMENLK